MPLLHIQIVCCSETKAPGIVSYISLGLIPYVCERLELYFRPLHISTVATVCLKHILYNSVCLTWHDRQQKLTVNRPQQYVPTKKNQVGKILFVSFPLTLFILRWSLLKIRWWSSRWRKFMASTQPQIWVMFFGVT